MIEIFAGSVILSIWYVTLFFEKEIGLSMILFIVPTVGFIIYLLKKNKKEINLKPTILIIPIVLLALTYLIFNNSFFYTLNKLVIPLLIIYMILEMFNETIEINTKLISKVMKIVFTPIAFIGESFEKLKQSIEEKIKINAKPSRKKNMVKVVKAILITLPIALLILLLLSSADQEFENIFSRILIDGLRLISKIHISTTLAKIMVTVVLFVYFIGFFYYISFKYEKDENEEEKKKQKDNFTIKMILAVLNIIYLVFCIIQIKSLLQDGSNLKYAYYAREGFFQLMIVSLINLVTILIAKRSEKHNKYIKLMCLIMVLFTFIILISSVTRMYLYESAYGYTLLRVLVSCALFAETILLIPTIIYILDKKIKLAKTYFTILITIYVCMNYANFDNLIAKRNIDRYEQIGKLDLYYLILNTNTDAVNQMSRLYNKEKSDENSTKVYLDQLYNKLEQEKMDFRNFNLSKIFAKNTIGEKLED